MTELMVVPRNRGNTKRIVSVIAISALLITCMILGQMSNSNRSRSGPTPTPISVTVAGGNPYWDVVGSMILYKDNSSAGNQSYWVAQSFQVEKPPSALAVVSLVIYVWLTRDVPPNSSFPTTVDNVTVFLTNATADGKPNIDRPIANQTISPENISAMGPYPRGLMETNNSLVVKLQYNASNPFVGFKDGEYFIFLYRKNLGDNDDYHIGYAYYWAASKLDLYYGGGSWVLDKNGEWKSYPNDMCFLLIEITFP
jgi:hypothetical protein